MKAHELTRIANIGGVPTRLLMRLFEVTMAIIFVLEFAAFEMNLLGTGLVGAVHFLTVLIATEVPLWFCQVILWERGERAFGAYEDRLIAAVRTIERIGFLVDFLDPALAALFAVRRSLSNDEARVVQAIQFISARTYIEGLKRMTHTSDPKVIEDVLGQYEEASRAWLKGEDANTTP